MSAATPPHAGRPLIDRLSEDKRNELIAIGREALRRFGYAYQQVFDDHLQIFTFLAARGATATMIGQMLAEVGIARKNGSALPAGTVSSALSRARERAQQRGAPLHIPAQPGMAVQVAASTGAAAQPCRPPQRRSLVASRPEASRSADAGPAPTISRDSATAECTGRHAAAGHHPPRCGTSRAVKEPGR